MTPFSRDVSSVDETDPTISFIVNQKPKSDVVSIFSNGASTATLLLSY